MTWASECAFLLALGLVRLLSTQRLARLVVDIPNDRSLHATPTPRTGGLGLMIAALVAGALVGGAPLPGLMLLTGLLAALFLVDDVGGLPVWVRFAAQLAAALAFLGLYGPYPWLLMPALALGIVWSVNLYNFMDGSNGLAGGMTLIGYATYALAAQQAGAADVAMLAAIVAAAAAGFLVWNFDPARIFLGDAGSIPLGFLAATLGVLGWSRGLWPFWFPPLVFSPFVVDASVTLVQRALRREKVSEAHKSHYYQRLVRMGWSHRRLALAAYWLMAAAAATALSARIAHPLVAANLLALWAAVYAVIALAIDRRWMAHRPGATL